MKWGTWTSAALGFWLVVAPFALGYTHVSVPLIEDMLGGILVLSVALSRALGGQVASGRHVRWLPALAGLWVFLAPFALGYTGVRGASSNDALVGLVVLLLGVASAAVGGRTSRAGTEPLAPEDAKAHGTRGADYRSQEFFTTRPRAGLDTIVWLLDQPQTRQEGGQPVEIIRHLQRHDSQRARLARGAGESHP